MEKKTHSDDYVVFQNAFYDMESGELINPIRTQNYSIVQVADSYYPTEFRILPHTQCCELEITLVAHGTLSVRTDNSKTELKRGEAHICFLGERHELICYPGVRFQTLAFNTEKRTDAKALIQELLRRDSRVYKSARLFDIFSGILSEFHDTGFAFRSMSLDSLISSALVSIASEARGRSQLFSYSPEELVTKTLNHIDKRECAERGLSELSSRFGYSYNHIYKTFKKHTGESLRSYSIRVKMEHARTLLLENKSISDVSATLGYSNPYNFSRAFKSFFGVSPSRIKESDSDA